MLIAQKLRSLRIAWGFPRAQFLPALESLSACVDPRFISSLTPLRNLRQLTLSLQLSLLFQRVTKTLGLQNALSRCLEPLNSLPELQSLSLSVEHPAQVQSFAALTAMARSAARWLTSLVVYTSTHEVVMPTAAAEHFGGIDLVEAQQWGDGLLTALGACSRLERLVLFRVFCTAAGARALGQAASLRSVSLRHRGPSSVIAAPAIVSGQQLLLLLRELPPRVEVRAQSLFLGQWLLDHVLIAKEHGSAAGVNVSSGAAKGKERLGEASSGSAAAEGDSSLWNVSASAALALLEGGRLTAVGRLRALAGPAAQAVRRLRSVRIDEEGADFAAL